MTNIFGVYQELLIKTEINKRIRGWQRSHDPMPYFIRNHGWKPTPPWEFPPYSFHELTSIKENYLKFQQVFGEPLKNKILDRSIMAEICDRARVNFQYPVIGGNEFEFLWDHIFGVLNLFLVNRQSRWTKWEPFFRLIATIHARIHNWKPNHFHKKPLYFLGTWDEMKVNTYKADPLYYPLYELYLQGKTKELWVLTDKYWNSDYGTIRYNYYHKIIVYIRGIVQKDGFKPFHNYTLNPKEHYEGYIHNRMTKFITIERKIMYEISKKIELFFLF